MNDQEIKQTFTHSPRFLKILMLAKSFTLALDNFFIAICNPNREVSPHFLAVWYQEKGWQVFQEKKASNK